MTLRPRAVGRAGLAVAAAAGLALALPLMASAQVTVHLDVDTSGSFAKLTVRVPNESETAGTVALRVQLPADPPLPFVSVSRTPAGRLNSPARLRPSPSRSASSPSTRSSRRSLGPLTTAFGSGPGSSTSSPSPSGRCLLPATTPWLPNRPTTTARWSRGPTGRTEGGLPLS